MEKIKEWCKKHKLKFEYYFEDIEVLITSQLCEQKAFNHFGQKSKVPHKSNYRIFSIHKVDKYNTHCDIYCIENSYGGRFKSETSFTPTSLHLMHIQELLKTADK